MSQSYKQVPVSVYRLRIRSRVIFISTAVVVIWKWPKLGYT